MSTDTNKAIVRRYVEQVVGKGHADLVGEFLVESIELHGTGLAPGLAAVEQWVAMTAAAFPDRHLTIDDVVAEGDRVVVRTTLNGTHQGEIQGIPATGKPVTQPSISIFRLANGKIVEGWFAADNLSMMQQLGVIPAQQAA
ncbi:MAG: ester cyclase [Candidatus Promineifilaceae bacterium]